MEQPKTNDFELSKNELLLEMAAVVNGCLLANLLKLPSPSLSSEQFMSGIQGAMLGFTLFHLVLIIKAILNKKGDILLRTIAPAFALSFVLFGPSIFKSLETSSGGAFVIVFLIMNIPKYLKEDKVIKE